MRSDTRYNFDAFIILMPLFLPPPPPPPPFKKERGVRAMITQQAMTNEQDMFKVNIEHTRTASIDFSTKSRR